MLCPRLVRPVCGLACLVSIVIGGGNSFAQQPPRESTGTSELGLRQVLITRQVEELERRFRTMARSLGKDEAENAERLVQALDEISARLVERRMRQITELLDQNDLQKAADSQSDLLQELQELLAGLLESPEEDSEQDDDALSQLKQALRDVLARQQKISQSTAGLDKQVGDSKPRRSQRLSILRLGRDEKELADRARQSVAGRSESLGEILPGIVNQIADDLQLIHDRINELKIGEATQSRQREVEVAIEEALAALEKSSPKKADESVSTSGNLPEGESGPSRLPDSAELKLIRAAQLRVNRRTAELDVRRGDGPLTDDLKREADAISRRQAQVIEMARKVLEKQNEMP